MTRSEADKYIEDVAIEIFDRTKDLIFLAVVKDKKAKGGYKVKFLAKSNRPELLFNDSDGEPLRPAYLKSSLDVYVNEVKESKTIITEESISKTPPFLGRFFKEFENSQKNDNKEVTDLFRDYAKEKIKDYKKNYTKQKRIERQIKIVEDLLNIKTDKSDIEVAIKKTEGIDYLSSPKIERGISVLNLTKSSSVGTLGGILKLSKKNDYFLISNHHVLMTKTGEIGNSIALENSQGGKTVIGELFWSRFDVNFDIAIAKITNINLLNINTCNECNGKIQKTIGRVKIGDKVSKCNYMYESSNDSIVLSDNAWVRVKKGKIYKNQIVTEKKISVRGDSGSLLVKTFDKTKSKKDQVVGLVFAGDEEHFTIANPLYDLFSEPVEYTIRYNQLFKNKNGKFIFEKFI